MQQNGNDSRDGARFETIDAYIDACPETIRPMLQALRTLIREEAPAVQERISWQMPTFWLNGNLVHFAANKAHIGFYPGSEAVEAFQDRLSTFKTTKGGIQLPYNKPLPEALIREIVRFRVAIRTAETQ